MRLSAIIILISLTKLSFGQVVLDPIPDQAIGREGSFEDINLGDFTTSDVFWEVNFLKSDVQDVKPTWTVNSNAFQFEMTLTAVVKSKGTQAIGNSHILSVSDVNGQVRSVGSAIQVQNDWIYFLSVYSNTNDEELFFNFYDDSLSQIIKGNESFIFGSNSVLGEPDNPHAVAVSFISYNLADDLLSFKVEDKGYIGSESLAITARNLSDPTDFAIDTITLTIEDDYTPILEGISDQTINFGENFTSFDLDDFTTLRDGDPIDFSFSGNTELQIDIDVDNLVSITRPDNWSGTEVITFTVTDQSTNAFSHSQQVTFKGKIQDQAPVISPIADRITGIGGAFESIELSDFVVASNPESVKWELEFLTDSIVASPDWTINTNEFEFNMSLTAKVTSLGKLLTGAGHKLAAYSSVENKLAGVTEAIEVDGDWFFFLTVNSNTDKDSIYFKVFDNESKRILPTESHLIFEANDIIGDPLDPFNIEAGYLLPTLDGSLLSFKLRKAEWSGTEIIRLTATDMATAQQLSHSDTVVFEVLNLKPPILENIPDQTIDEGSAYSSINLSDYLKNATIGEVTFDIIGADTLKPALNDAVLTFSIEDNDYFGSEVLSIKVTSISNPDLVDIAEVSLIVNNVNDAPVITTTPENTAAIGNVYSYNLEATDADADALEISATGLPSWLFFVPNAKGAIILGIPTASDAGEYNITIDVSDGQKIVQQQFSIVVSSAQINPISTQTVNEGASFTAIDLDDHLTIIGSVSTYWVVSGGNELTFNLDGANELTIQTPNNDWFGTETIIVKLFDQSNDNLLDEHSIIFEVINVNDAPVITTTPGSIAAIGSVYSYSLKAEDKDKDQLTTTAINLPSWLTIETNSAGAVIFGEPNSANAGSNSFTIEVSDGIETVQQLIDIEVSLAQITPINNQTINEGASFSAIDLDDYLTIIGSISTYWEVTSGNELTTSIDAENILTIQTPNDDWFGSETIIVKLFDLDDNDLLDEHSITFEVININDAPEFQSNPSGEYSAEEQFLIKILVQDIEGDAISYSMIDAPSWLTLFTEVDGFTLFGQPDLLNQTYNFEVVADDGTTQSTLSIQVITSFVLSIEHVKVGISVFPNPSNGILNIDSNFPILELSIIDQAGKRVMNFYNIEKSIDVSGLNKGLYFLKVDDKQTLKFIKQ